MGTNYNGEEYNRGIIANVMETIFSRVEATRNSTEFLIRVSFIEVSRRTRSFFQFHFVHDGLLTCLLLNL